MDEFQFLSALKPYYEAFAEHDETQRLQLLRAAMTPDAEIWGPKRVFAGYEQISEKIAGFHQNWPGCRLVLSTVHACVAPSSVRMAKCSPEAMRSLNWPRTAASSVSSPFWEAPPPIPAAWPRTLAAPA